MGSAVLGAGLGRLPAELESGGRHADRPPTSGKPSC